MKIGKPRANGIAGTRPIRSKGDPLPEGYTFGQPTKYRPEYCEAIVAYFDVPVSWEKYVTPKGQVQIIPDNKLPTFARFARSLGVGDNTLTKWCNKHPEFAEAYAQAKELQKSFLMELSAAGIGSSAVGLMLRANHGMVEPKEASPVDTLAEQLANLVDKMPS